MNIKVCWSHYYFYLLHYLTNKDTLKWLNKLCSVVNHTGSGYERRVGGNTRCTVVECFCLLLECSSCFLNSQASLLVYNKETVKFPMHFFLRLKNNYYIGRWCDSFRSVFYALISTLSQPIRVFVISELY